MNKKEKSVLEEIKQDMKEIKEMLENPKGLLDGEKSQGQEITEKQKKYLQDLGYKGKLSISKIEAKQLIKEFLKNERNI